METWALLEGWEWLALASRSLKAHVVDVPELQLPFPVATFESPSGAVVISLRACFGIVPLGGEADVAGRVGIQVMVAAHSFLGLASHGLVQQVRIEDEAADEAYLQV